VLKGERLGPYEICGPLGAGGMGEVYRAHDAKLDRDVAIKILPEATSSDPERRARFEREARILAALNHPLVAAIYGVEQHGERAALVLELVDGPTLAERLVQGPLPVPEALSVAQQVAEAIGAAHERGIIHRDLKPANIKITPDGRVKVLDFGLAKEIDRRDQDASDRPTRTTMPTRAGTVLGTTAYMSPEQTRGGPMDKRTDIWSFGCVLFEMLTGHAAFGRGTLSDTIAAIIDRAPDWSQLPAGTPERTRRLLARCLEKDPTRRLRDIGEARVDIDETLRPSGGTEGRPAARIGGRWRWAVGVAFAAGVIGLALVNADRLRAVLTGSPGSGRITSLAVLPFTNVSGGADLDYESDGITDRIIDQLSQLPDLKVMSHRSAFLFKGKDVDAKEVGRQLGVAAVLTGRVKTRNDIVTIDLELVDARDDSHLWGEEYVRHASELITLHSEIPVAIAERLGGRLPGALKARLTRQQTENVDAYRLYLQGRQAEERWTGEGSKAALAYFQQAIAIDPRYALAYSGMADVYLIGTDVGVSAAEAVRVAREAVTKALALDPMLGEAHASRAQLLFNADWNFPEADREFRRAIELSPSHIEGHHMYSHFLLAVGRIDESLVESRKLLELDPVSPWSLGHLGFHQLVAHQYDDAIRTLRDYMAKSAGADDYAGQLGDAYYAKGMMREAFEQFISQDGTRARPEAVAALRRGFEQHGMAGYLRARVALLNATPSALWGRADAETIDGDLADTYARLGERELSFARLQRLLAQHATSLVYLRQGIGFVSLYADPRFNDVLRQVGLPPV
jgi:eukaryotic-like serine/threonine-protein kinase